MKHGWSIPLLLLCAIAPGCESPVETGLVELDELSLDATVDAATVQRGGASSFDDLAAKIPGFAGYWFDRGCNLNVNLVDLTYAERVKELLAPLLRRRLAASPDCPATATILIHEVEYSWLELSGWLGKAQPVTRIGGVLRLGINVPANRIAIGVTSREAAGHVINALQELDVPIAAVMFHLVSATTDQRRRG
jgi:hypothetical protein